MSRTTYNTRLSAKQVRQAMEHGKLLDLMEKLEGTLDQDIELLAPQERVKIYVDIVKHIVPRGAGDTAEVQARPSTDTERLRSLFNNTTTPKQQLN